MPTPSPQDISNQATALTLRGDTPGLNSFIASWYTLMDFTDRWGPGTFNAFQYITQLIQESY